MMVCQVEPFMGYYSLGRAQSFFGRYRVMRYQNSTIDFSDCDIFKETRRDLLVNRHRDLNLRFLDYLQLRSISAHLNVMVGHS